MNLISLSDLVLNEDLQDTIDKDVAEIHRNYARFLKTRYLLGYFIPTDENDEPLQEPKTDDLNSTFCEKQIYFNEKVKFDIARIQVMFKGFELEAKGGDWIALKHISGSQLILHKNMGLIENLLRHHYDIELTETAIINLGLNV